MDDQPSVIRDAIAASADGECAQALLLGFVVVAEWMDPDGGRWLSRESGSGSGDDLPKWICRGYLNEALNFWPEDEGEDGEDE
jgi:hypothetical protein